MKRKIAVVLSGCGYLDGAEITESISTLIALDQCGVDYECFAPNIDFSSVNHLSKEADGLKRNTLLEAARIARSEIKPLDTLEEAKFDGVVFPGGYGAATHLSTFAEKGADGVVRDEVQKIFASFYKASKPIAAFCIAPATLALALGNENIQVTIGNDKATAAQIEKTGAQHVDCEVDDYVTDREHKVVTSPAYMYGDAKPAKVFAGIQKAIREFVEMA